MPLDERFELPPRLRRLTLGGLERLMVLLVHGGADSLAIGVHAISTS